MCSGKSFFYPLAGFSVTYQPAHVKCILKIFNISQFVIFEKEQIGRFFNLPFLCNGKLGGGYDIFTPLSACHTVVVGSYYCNRKTSKTSAFKRFLSSGHIMVKHFSILIFLNISTCQNKNIVTIRFFSIQKSKHIFSYYTVRCIDETSYKWYNNYEIRKNQHCYQVY